jgi:hypothetical protein
MNIRDEIGVDKNMLSNEKIRIGDLSNPDYSEKAMQMLSMVKGVETELSVASVYRAAEAQQNNIDIYSDEGLIERIAILCEAYNEDADLSAMGRMSILNMLATYLVQRSRLEDLFRRHPEIEDEEITRPIIITGFPRSGTTHLLNLISVDERLRSLRYWESLEPIPSNNEQSISGREDPRIQRCRDQLAVRKELMPLFDAMHEMHPDHIHEEIELLAMDFSTALFETRGLIPRWTEYYTSHNQTPHYGFLKRALKALQWLRGPKRWLLKSPQHMEQLVPLRQVFPDATFVLTHRDPAAVIASWLTMLAYSARMSRDPVRPVDMGDYYTSRMLGRLQKYISDRDTLPADQSIDVLFHEFMNDDVAMIERIYKLAGLPLTKEVRDAMNDYINHNPRGKHGQVVYDLKADFGLSVDELRQKMSSYYEKFPVKNEHEREASRHRD